MSIALTYELQEEIKRLMIAGGELAKGDYRLKKLLPGLQKSGESAAVFKKIAEILEGIIEAPDKASPALIELAALTNAVLYTQGKTSADGEIELYNGERIKLDTSVNYRRIAPVIKALTTKASGRYEVIRSAFDEGILGDLRLLEVLVYALGDQYSEIPPLVSSALEKIGTPALSVLLRTFVMNDDKKYINAITVICKIAGIAQKQLYDQILADGTPKLKAALIISLGSMREYEDIIIGFTKDKKKPIREAAVEALGAAKTMKARATLFGLFRSKDYEAAAASLKTNMDSELEEELLAYAEEQIPDVIAEFDAAPKEKTDKPYEYVNLAKLTWTLGLLSSASESENLLHLYGICLDLQRKYRKNVGESTSSYYSVLGSGNATIGMFSACGLYKFDSKKSREILTSYNNLFENRICTDDGIFESMILLDAKTLNPKEFYDKYHKLYKPAGRSRRGDCSVDDFFLECNNILTQAAYEDDEGYYSYNRLDIVSRGYVYDHLLAFDGAKRRYTFADFVPDDRWFDLFIKHNQTDAIKTYIKKYDKAVEKYCYSRMGADKGKLNQGELSIIVDIFDKIGVSDYHDKLFKCTADMIAEQSKRRNYFYMGSLGNKIEAMPPELKAKFVKAIDKLNIELKASILEEIGFQSKTE